MTYEYDSLYDAWVRVARGSSQTQYSFDGLGRLRATANQVGLQTYTVRDACGRVTEASLPYTTAEAAGARVFTYYDALGRVTKLKDSANRDTLFAYTGIDVTRTDAKGRTTVFDSSAFGSPSAAHLMSVRDANNITTSYTYDVTGQLASATVPGTGLTRTWVRNGLGLLVSETHPESGTTTFTYDAAANLTRTTDAATQIVDRSYDGDNRLTFVNVPGPPTT